jgi:hypothetical protein
MSKAFVRESDEEEDRPEEPQALPVGFKNYMTPHGIVNCRGSYGRYFGSSAQR